MPLTPRLEGVFRQRIAQLPPAAQTVLLIAAADNTGDTSAVLRAAAGLQLPADALSLAHGRNAVRSHGRGVILRRCGRRLARPRNRQTGMAGSCYCDELPSQAE
jgi:hypothetical protein